MKKNRLLFFLLWCGQILFYECSGDNEADCNFMPIITISTNASNPCLSTGSIEISSPIDADYLYKVDQRSFQTSTLFGNISVGKHMVYVKDSNGCEASKEVSVDTIARGTKFEEVATILKTRCELCHSGLNPQAGLDFTKNCDILSNWNRIQARAIEGNPAPMPPTGLIPLEERNKILLWINSGHKYDE
jgi:hypothetical protein